MMTTKRRLLGAAALALSAALSASLCASAWAQADKSVNDLTDAEVRKVDKDNRKITLKHGAIPSLDMPPMTMVFSVRDAAWLDKVQAGDKVRFKAVNEAGKFTVTEMQPLK
jgi:Cu(I)/Ag(I) efflux system periplasmic protein CusF